MRQHTYVLSFKHEDTFSLSSCIALHFWAGVEDGWVGVGHFKGKVFDDIVKAGQTNTELPISRKPRDRENETTSLNIF